MDRIILSAVEYINFDGTSGGKAIEMWWCWRENNKNVVAVVVVVGKNKRNVVVVMVKGIQ